MPSLALRSILTPTLTGRRCSMTHSTADQNAASPRCPLTLPSSARRVHLSLSSLSPGTLEPQRAAVPRGRVRTQEGNPLPGVKITLLGHPEFGSTESRMDGAYDMAVNGGGQFTISYETDHATELADLAVCILRGDTNQAPTIAHPVALLPFRLARTKAPEDDTI
jgi:hypothetical protein